MKSYLFRLAWQSAWSRRYVLMLTWLSIVLASFLLLSVEHLRVQVRAGFESAVSGTDLVVGPRGSSVQLMLYSVFRIGEPSANIDWSSAQALAKHPAVAWSIPISLGDSYRSYPVMGTSAAYFQHFQYGARQPLRLAQGKAFREGTEGVFEAVLGAQVAQNLGLKLDDALVLTHGSAALEEDLAQAHADKPFRVVGILAATGTPVDRTVHISLAGMQAVHLGWEGGMPLPGVKIPAQWVSKFDLTPQSVTAVLIGLKQRSDVFRLQREINMRAGEPLMAVMPGVALDDLWQVVGYVERALWATTILVAWVSLASLAATILAGLDARRRELAILRSVGARPQELLLLLVFEAAAVSLLGVIVGLLLRWAGMVVFADTLQAQLGIPFAGAIIFGSDAWLLVAILVCAVLAGLLPGWRAYRLSLVDGLSPR